LDKCGKEDYVSIRRSIFRKFKEFYSKEHYKSYIAENQNFNEMLKFLISSMEEKDRKATKHLLA
jgi:hypothetical protein